MAKLLIVSNRLPISVKMTDGKFNFQPSAGGLATGLKSFHENGNTTWIGWPGLTFSPEEDTSEITSQLEASNFVPVYLSAEDIEAFYEGFSNTTIWPLFHYFQQFTQFKTSFWESYCKVNQVYCDEILKLVQPDDQIWVHDYQLMLLPALLRKRLPQTTIGFFLHIPFPSFELFRALPWRKELLEGLLGADYIAFHTFDYTAHFLTTTTRILEFEHVLGRIQVQNRFVEVDSLPMGIDYEKYSNAVKEPETIAEVVKFRQQFGNLKVMLSIDRLDYSKGILQRLEAFEELIIQYPEYQERVSLIVVLVPSRAGVEQYQALKTQIDETVGRINGQHNTINWRPIHYFYRSLDFHTLCALYYLSEVALVTPFRDGMNLVSKEFLACKIDKKGVLVLSEMAGSAKELTDAILVNPHDKNSLVQAMVQALEMPQEEQTKRVEAMQKTIAQQNVQWWAATFLDRLNATRIRKGNLQQKHLTTEIRDQLVRKYIDAEHRLLLLDYDGTLVNFSSDPLLATPDQDLIATLARLCQDSRTSVVLISGRNKAFLERWFGNLPLTLVAEHGIWHREKGKDWVSISLPEQNWKPGIQEILELFVDRTPGSFIEEKDFSLAWHYRNADVELAKVRTRELVTQLTRSIASFPLQILEGNKVIEIKNLAINKGKAIEEKVKDPSFDFIAAIGDDTTDEDMFKTCGPEAYSIKVGFEETSARYNIGSVVEVRQLLQQFLVPLPGAAKNHRLPQQG